MEKYGIIYKIRNKINNKIYIGQTIRKFKKRYSGELEKRTHNEHLKRSIQKYGIENFEIDEEFDIAYSKEELDKLEDMYIKIYNCCDENYGYNNKFGGANGRFSEQTKQKLKENSPHLSGENHPFYGKHHTEEAKENLREKLKGKNAPSARAIYCYEKNDIRLCGKDWADELKINRKHIGSCCTGKRKSTGGYHFRYAIEEEIEEYKKNKGLI